MTHFPPEPPEDTPVGTDDAYGLRAPSSKGPGSRRSTKWPLPIWVTVLIAVLFVVSIIGYLRPSRHLDQTQATELVPDSDYALNEDRNSLPPGLELTDLENNAIPMDSFKGRVVLLSFWASWCVPCITELPQFAALKDKYQKSGLDIVAVNLDSAREDADKFIKEFWPLKKLNFATFFDPNMHVAQKMSISALPSNFIIDRKGRVALSGLGMDDWESPEVIETLENILAESQN